MDRSKIKSDYTFIYALLHPITGKTRYIGKSNYPKERLSVHLKKAQKGVRGHLYNWIRKLIEESYEPLLQILEVVRKSNWRTAERFWIKYYKTARVDLTNILPGGEGNSFKHTLEAKKKISDAQRGKPSKYKGHKHTLETIEKIRFANSGSRHSQYGVPKSEKTKRRISRTKKERFLHGEYS